MNLLGRRPPVRIPGRTLALALGLASAVSGCHSASIEATLVNASGAPVSLIQVDYPSASFGVQTLAPGQRFAYRFKVQGAGPIKLTYTDAAQHAHHVDGPVLREGSDGSLQIVLSPDGVHWNSGG